MWLSSHRISRARRWQGRRVSTFTILQRTGAEFSGLESGILSASLNSVSVEIAGLSLSSRVTRFTCTISLWARRALFLPQRAEPTPRVYRHRRRFQTTGAMLFLAAQRQTCLADRKSVV